LEGVIVVKNSLQINFARNQIIRTCKRWKTIEALLTETGIEETKQKVKLGDSEARSFLSRYAGGEGISYRDFRSVACIPDSNGKMWSVDAIQRLCNAGSDKTRILRGPLGEVRIGFEPRGSRVGDKVMQMRKALVLDQVNIDMMGCKKPQEVIDLITGKFKPNQDAKVYVSHSTFSGKLSLCDPKTLLESQDTEHRLLDVGVLTPREKDFLNALRGAQWRLENATNSRPKPYEQFRKLAVGESATNNGWTDGSTYVAINRQFIKDLNLGMERDWYAAVLLLTHEDCHGEPDTDAHQHGPEFYENFHDLTVKYGADQGRHCYQTYRQTLRHRTKKLPQAMINAVHVEAETYANEQFAYKEVAK